MERCSRLHHPMRYMIKRPGLTETSDLSSSGRSGRSGIDRAWGGGGCGQHAAVATRQRCLETATLFECSLCDVFAIDFQEVKQEGGCPIA